MSEINILPYDGEAVYYGSIMDGATHDCMVALFEEIDWKEEEFNFFGRLLVPKRKVAWYGNEGLVYNYSGQNKIACAWTPVLQHLRQFVEHKSGEVFNACLLNYYPNGEAGMGWHSDDEKGLKLNGTIASLSLGVARAFSFKHKKTQEKIDLQLEDGSLLLMRAETQNHWLHQLPVRKKIKGARINLTFRMVDV